MVSRGLLVFLAQAQNWPDFNAARLRTSDTDVHARASVALRLDWLRDGCHRSRRIRTRLNGQYSLGVQNPCLPLDL